SHVFCDARSSAIYTLSLHDALPIFSYLDIAKLCGSPGAVRAVGRANSTNKIPILIPCHRVIGKNGNLVGYSGGITTKIWLLDHEDRKSTRLNSSHVKISYAVFCLKK